MRIETFSRSYGLNKEVSRKVRKEFFYPNYSIRNFDLDKLLEVLGNR